jgi:hypothetical protein
MNLSLALGQRKGYAFSLTRAAIRANLSHAGTLNAARMHNYSRENAHFVAQEFRYAAHECLKRQDLQEFAQCFAAVVVYRKLARSRFTSEQS